MEVLTPEIVKRDEQDLTFSKPKVKRKDIIKYLEMNEINKVIEEMEKPRDRMFIIMLSRMGLRVSEVINITKGDIDFKNSLLTAKHQKSRRFKRRVVPIHKTLIEPLKFFTAGLLDKDKLFNMTRQNAFYIVKKYLGVSPHVLRHSFAVHFLQSTNDIVTLSKLLGHSHINTTMHYAQFAPELQHKKLQGVEF